MNSKTVITKETKNKIHVDYEGKLSFKERLKKKFQSSNTWIKGIVSVLKFVLMLGVSYVILYPFFSKIAGSFMGKLDVIDPTVSLIPKHFTLDIYKYIVLDNHYFKAFFNTLLLSLICALIQTFIACLIGYGLAKFKFKGNKLVMIAVVVTMIIPHNTLKIAMSHRFLHFDLFGLKMFNNNGMLTWLFGQIELTDTMWPFVIFSIGGIAFKNGLYIYMMRQFFKGVPDELEESAYVDGANTFRTFLQIILPLSVPMMITIFIFSFSWQWTDQFYITLFSSGLEDRSIWTMVNVVNTETSLKDAAFAGNDLYMDIVKDTAGIMVIFPLVIMYLFCQKYIVQGIERSGITG